MCLPEGHSSRNNSRNPAGRASSRAGSKRLIRTAKRSTRRVPATVLSEACGRVFHYLNVFSDKPVCAENLVRFGFDTESFSVNHDDISLEPGCLALQSKSRLEAENAALRQADFH